ncbi:quaternary amine ABC transporter ATP-binding protein [Saccharopolyspora erythraea]|uniref:quaternary amine ABC transporter ATP-binding protein n=1 Tax=Saccharopolyspora erythraea TaxID=1836 RepID=UPI00038D8D4B|nr:glycine betaine/L-proline ABC transporter ATP-binding protein [Saccharopolyspora erythraea]EQD84976.1 glycine/betaine ABC transporter ATPase [Saccharopolyspora erythraea D]QRK92102.1 glycine betaine/L-proline ABC transporter ATP-binding protein [Saccharopolyspora erythraea]
MEIRVDGLYKVFGPDPAEAVQRLRLGAVTAEELREEGKTAAVVDANFHVRPGETFVVMGLSGSGKSTLIRMVNGLLGPTAGHVYVDGQDISTMSAKNVRLVRQNSMSMVFQHFALLPHRTVLDNAAYGLQVRDRPEGERLKKARESLALVGLDGWEDQFPQQLSGGMRQRVGLARALATGTDVMLMDEAFSALDPLIRREMQDQLLQLQASLSKTILFITHDLNEAMRIGDRIAMMRDGRIVQIGTAEDILSRPATDYVAQFMRDVDRVRVLTASLVANRDELVLHADSDPAAALRTMRAHGLAGLVVLDAQRRVAGFVTEADAERALAAGRAQVGTPSAAVLPTARHDTPLAELCTPLSQTNCGLAVLDPDERLVGVVTRGALLNALGETSAAG